SKKSHLALSVVGDNHNRRRAAGTDRRRVVQRFLAARGSACLERLDCRKADIGDQMIGRRREGWSDHALGHDAGRALQPRGGIRQVFLAIGAVELLHVLGWGYMISRWAVMDIPFGLGVEQREPYRLGSSTHWVWIPDRQQSPRFDAPSGRKP